MIEAWDSRAGPLRRGGLTGPVMLYDALIAPFAEFEFMRRALVGAVALAIGAGPIGVFLMLRRMSLTGDAMAHAILPGAAVGFLVAGLSLARDDARRTRRGPRRRACSPASSPASPSCARMRPSRPST